MTAISLTNIAKLLNLNIRRVRHVVDREAIPECSWYDPNEFQDEGQRGSPRMVDLTTATIIGVATMMLNSGLQSERIRQLLEKAFCVPTPGRNQLKLPLVAHAFGSDVDAYILVSERDYIRCVVGKLDSGWVNPDDNYAKLDNYYPLLTTTIHLGRVRDLLTDTTSA